MPGLSLSLLGTFRVHRVAGPAIHFETNKARALLAYLAVETEPHTRLHLAGLLWPEWPEAAARTYLRQALLNLRQVLDQPDGAKPYLLGNRQTIQFNPESDYWLDVAALTYALSMLPQLRRSMPPLRRCNAWRKPLASSRVTFSKASSWMDALLTMGGNC